MLKKAVEQIRLTNKNNCVIDKKDIYYWTVFYDEKGWCIFGPFYTFSSAYANGIQWYKIVNNPYSSFVVLSEVDIEDDKYMTKIYNEVENE